MIEFSDRVLSRAPGAGTSGSSVPCKANRGEEDTVIGNWYTARFADIGPTRALTMAFLMPAFGMLWGALFLDEPITLPMIAGCALVIGGATVVLRPAPARRL